VIGTIHLKIQTQEDTPHFACTPKKSDPEQMTENLFEVTCQKCLLLIERAALLKKGKLEPEHKLCCTLCNVVLLDTDFKTHYTSEMHIATLQRRKLTVVNLPKTVGYNIIMEQKKLLIQDDAGAKTCGLQ
jgi:hypothetical protein